MTALQEELVRRIAANGPLTMAEFMGECLFHPRHGYYTTRDPIGAAGDFITAPEISQMFGEMLGLALAQTWIDQGSPPAFVLCELGPGRGTLMVDILRATRQVPGFHDAASVYLVEASDRLRQVQAAALPTARHLDTVGDLPEAPLFIVANEFFDALPVRQFQRQGDGWREGIIGQQDGRLQRMLGPATTFGDLQDRLADTRDGDWVELCPALPGIVQQLGARIATHGGAAFLIDYGDWHSLGDTVQAMAQHKTVDPLTDPGRVDLTAHVDFAAIAAAADPARHTRLTPQGIFLERLGITARAQTLAQGLTGPALEQHVAAHRRLTHPDEMGDHFKVMGLLPPQAPPLPGLQS